MAKLPLWFEINIDLSRVKIMHYKIPTPIEEISGKGNNMPFCLICYWSLLTWAGFSLTWRYKTVFHDHFLGHEVHIRVHFGRAYFFPLQKMHAFILNSFRTLFAPLLDKYHLWCFCYDPTHSRYQKCRGMESCGHSELAFSFPSPAADFQTEHPRSCRTCYSESRDGAFSPKAAHVW